MVNTRKFVWCSSSCFSLFKFVFFSDECRETCNLNANICHSYTSFYYFDIKCSIHKFKRECFLRFSCTFFYCRFSNSNLIPLIGLATISCTNFILSRGSTDVNLKFRIIVDNITFSSNCANFWPMQLRGPALNGMKVYGWKFFLFSGRNRSGSNFSVKK